MDIKDKVALRVKETEQKNSRDASSLPDSEFILKSLDNNVSGDADLFKKLYRDDFVFNVSMDSWMSWGGHHWKIDKMDSAMASVAGVAKLYFDEMNKISKKIRELKDDDPAEKMLKLQRKKYKNRFYALMDLPRRLRVLALARAGNDALAIPGDEVDQKPWLLPVPNGVINLKTGELEDGRRTDFLIKACLAEWPKEGIEDANPEVFLGSLNEMFSGNRDLVDFFQRVLGYSLIGSVRESVFVVLSGRGRNGKSLIVETKSKIMGPLAGAIRSEMLLDQNRSGNPSGPTPDIMALRGKRLAFASETDDGRRISTSRIKWLTGNDTITGRNPHDKYEVSFLPSHTLFLLTNNKPHAPAADFAFWERMILIPFGVSFVNREPQNENERRADPDLPEKLEKELPQILAWMVKGCLEYQRVGLNPPPVVKAAVDEYRRDEDLLADFVEECCIEGDGYTVGATKAYEAFKDWWKNNVSNRVPSQKAFGSLFKKRGYEKRKGQTVSYYGVGLLDA